MTDRFDFIGSSADRFVLLLGEESLYNMSEYTVKCSVFSQPATFSVTAGWGAIASDLLAKGPPFTKYQLLLGEEKTPVQTGYIDGHGSPGGNSTEVNFRGRDMMAWLYDSSFHADQTFCDQTYLQITQWATEQCVPDQWVIYSSNDANRKALVKKQTIEYEPEPVAGDLPSWRDRQDNPYQTPASDETVSQTKKERKIRASYNKLTAKVGEGYYQWLTREYKKAGLFLWCAGDGSFVLSAPNANQEPVARLVRRRGDTRDKTNIIKCRYDNNTRPRFGKTVVWFRTGGGRSKRESQSAEAIDQEMIDWGFELKTRHISDRDITTQQAARNAALRNVAEQRRAGFHLEYIVSGHHVPSIDDGTPIPWTCDTVIELDDEELDLHGRYYVSDVTYNVGAKTETSVTLMRPSDMVFAEGA